MNLLHFAWIVFPAAGLIFLILVFGKYRALFRVDADGGKIRLSMETVSGGRLVGFVWNNRGDAGLGLVLFGRILNIGKSRGKKGNAAGEGGAGEDGKGGKEKRRKKEGKPAKGKRRGIGLFRPEKKYSALRLVRYMPGPALESAGRMMRRIQWKECLLDLTVGTGDPAVTGQLFGLSCAAQPFLPAGAKLRLKPEFGRKMFTGTGRIEFGFVLWSLLAEAVRSFIPIARSLRRCRTQKT